MKAVQYRGLNDVVIAEVPEPELLPGHVLVRVTASGVCRTDVHVRRAKEQGARVVYRDASFIVFKL